MSQYKRDFRLAYDYLERHTPPQATPEWWTAAAKEISTTWSQGGRSQLLHSLLSAVYEELERIKPARDAESGF